jgi:aminoglycoside phosphotransferase (APT) family kinase protein
MSDPDPRSLRFTGRTVGEALDVLRGEFEWLGVPWGEPRVIQVSENLTVHLPDAAMVLRLHHRDRSVFEVLTEATVSDQLHQAGIPVAHSHPCFGPTPVETSLGQVSLWEYEEPARVPLSPAEKNDALGRILFAVHQLHPGQFDVPTWNPLVRVPGRIAALRQRPGLAAAADLIEASYTRLNEALHCDLGDLPHRLIHGDAHMWNVYPSRRGVLLLDWEHVATGPLIWDLVVNASIMERRATSEDDYLRLARAYGYDVRSHPRYTLLRQVRELLSVSWLSQLIDHEECLVEFERRLPAISDPSDETVWSISLPVGVPTKSPGDGTDEV